MVNPMTAATTPDIAPRLVEGEPVCSGEECPEHFTGKDAFLYVHHHCRRANKLGVEIHSGDPCTPGLRRQRDALQAEIDRLQRKGK